VAVVSWNTRELLSRCLESLRADVDAGLAAVWVVDNASSDGSADLVRREMPWATLIEAGGNVGFGPAVNLVAERTDSPWLAPANADVAMTPGALEALLATGEREGAAIVAPRLILPDGETQQSLHPFPTLAFTIAFNLGLFRFSRRLSERYCLDGKWDPDHPRTVPWAVGAFLLVRREDFAGVGGFDAEQWMYAEDLDLGWRVAGSGGTTRYEPRAHVRHEESAATNAAFGDEKATRFMGATYRVIRRRRGRVVAALTAVTNWVGAATRLAWLTPLSRRNEYWAGERDNARAWLTAHRRAIRAALT